MPRSSRMSTINVARSADEAARQARGEQVTGKAMDEAEEEAAEPRGSPPRNCSKMARLPRAAGRETRGERSRRSDLRRLLE